MLHHEDSPQNIPAAPPFPAAQVRVTPEELAAAVARLETRKAGTDGKIAIGEAVRELSLDSTPEEVLAEVQAGRQAQATTAPLKKKQRLGLRLAATATLLAFLVGSSSVLMVHRSPIPATAIVSPAINLSPPNPQSASIPAPTTLLVRDAAGKIDLLSEVPDHQPVSAVLTSTGDAVQWTNFSPSPVTWTLIKHEGRVYLRGWIADTSDAALRVSSVQIHPTRAYDLATGLHPVPVTLPLNGFRVMPGLTNDGMITADTLQPDAHFREKW